MACPSRLDNETNAIDLGAENDRISNGNQWRRVDDNQIKFAFQIGQQVAHALGEQNLGGVRQRRAAGHHGQILVLLLIHGVSRRDAIDQNIGQAGLSSHAENFMNDGTSEIAVNQQDAHSASGKRLRHIDGGERLAFALARAGHEYALQNPVGIDKRKINQQRVISFVNMSAVAVEIGQQLLRRGHHLVLMPFDQAQRPVVASAVLALYGWNRGKHRQIHVFFHVFARLERSIERLQNEAQANAQRQSQKKADNEIANFVGLGGQERLFSRIDDLNITDFAGFVDAHFFAFLAQHGINSVVDVAVAKQARQLQLFRWKPLQLVFIAG